MHLIQRFAGTASDSQDIFGSHSTAQPWKDSQAPASSMQYPGQLQVDRAVKVQHTCGQCPACSVAPPLGRSLAPGSVAVSLARSRRRSLARSLLALARPLHWPRTTLSPSPALSSAQFCSVLSCVAIVPNRRALTVPCVHVDHPIACNRTHRTLGAELAWGCRIPLYHVPWVCVSALYLT